MFEQHIFRENCKIINKLSLIFGIYVFCIHLIIDYVLLQSLQINTYILFYGETYKYSLQTNVQIDNYFVYILFMSSETLRKHYILITCTIVLEILFKNITTISFEIR